jgi:hypothetical protein
MSKPRLQQWAVDPGFESSMTGSLCIGMRNRGTDDCCGFARMILQGDPSHY